jgi:hypothetical protein
MGTMKKKKSALPKSTAKTAYGLLSEIRRLILAEPLRYNQGAWLTFRDAGRVYDQAPACGTVGCVAGWVCALKADDPGAVEQRWRGVEDFARRTLRLTERLSDELFNGDVAGVDYQTKGHARRGARHIARFQKRYAAQLKATRV